MRMKISKRRLKELLAEEIEKLRNEKADYDKMQRNQDDAADKVARNRKGKKLHPAGKAMEEGIDDYHDDDWVDVLSKEEPPDGPSPALPHEALEDKIYDLIDVIDSAGEYDPELTDAYVALLRAMKESGIRLDRLMMLAENKK